MFNQKKRRHNIVFGSCGTRDSCHNIFKSSSSSGIFPDLPCDFHQCSCRVSRVDDFACKRLTVEFLVDIFVVVAKFFGNVSLSLCRIRWKMLFIWQEKASIHADISGVSAVEYSLHQ